MNKRKIALIAHDGKEAEMVAFLNQNKELSNIRKLSKKEWNFKMNLKWLLL